MPMDNYTDFVSYIVSQSHRTDIASMIDDFIRTAEMYINSDVMTNKLGIEMPLTATVSSRDVALPSDFNCNIALYYENVQPREELVYMPPEQLQLDVYAGIPRRYTIKSGVIQLNAIADQPYSLTLFYNAKVALSPSSPTNYILTKYPNIYRAAVLREVAIYTRDQEDYALFDGLYREAVLKANVQEQSLENNATKHVDNELIMRPLFNILEG